MHVLIADDSETQRRILHELLSHWNMRPTTVSSGADALTAMKDANQHGDQFRLALIDANMPGMSGFDVANEIAHDPQLVPATVLMINSGNLVAEETRCKDLGVTGWINKPLHQSELLNALTMANRLSLEFKDRSLPNAEVSPQSVRTGLQILVIEDNAINQKVVARMLQKRGHKVEFAASGEEGLKVLAQRVFDLILMDMQLPGLDGFQVTARIRSDESGTCRHIPIVALTANALSGDREQCLAAGMDGYVSKPIIAVELFSVIESVVATTGTSAAGAMDVIDVQPSGATVGPAVSPNCRHQPANARSGNARQTNPALADGT